VSYSIIVTTSRRSNPRVRSIANELAAVLPGAVKVNRGKMSLRDLYEHAKWVGAKRIVMVCRGLRGNPRRIIFMDSTGEAPAFYPLILKIRGVKLARELGGRRRKATSMVVYVEQEDLKGFAHELAGALALSVIEDVARDEAHLYSDSLLFVEPVKSPRAEVALWFLDSKNWEPIGPRILVEEYYHRGLGMHEV